MEESLPLESARDSPRLIKVRRRKSEHGGRSGAKKPFRWTGIAGITAGLAGGFLAGFYFGQSFEENAQGKTAALAAERSAAQSEKSAKAAPVQAPNLAAFAPGGGTQKALGNAPAAAEVEPPPLAKGEYIAGHTYPVENGPKWVYLGGPTGSRASWRVTGTNGEFIMPRSPNLAISRLFTWSDSLGVNWRLTGELDSDGHPLVSRMR